MLTGQTEFDRGYEHNILVNAFALGYFGKKDRVFLSSAYGVGYDVVYVGSQTGRDGIHGASMASKPTDDLQQVDSRPTVQIGDPFFEKLLIESCLEAMQANLIEAIQDMGASGLTSSSFEMASKGRVGMQLHLDLVPLRDATLTPEDILLSESQERMLLVCQKQNFQKLQAIFSKWDLEAKKIGQIIKEREIQIYWKDNILTKIDPDILVKQAPEYNRPYHKSTKDTLFKTFFSKVSLSPKTKTDSNMIWKKLSDVQGRSRRFIFQQYDQRVGANTCRDCDYSVGVLKLPESQRDLGIVLGGRPHLMQQDAFKGGIDGVTYPVLQLAIKGFEPLALTNGLNFGNPENPKVMTDFVKTVEGMNLACKALQIPIISGNVSFYNEFQGQNVIPTPAIGLVGLRKAQGRLPDDYVLEEGCAVLLLESPEICGEKGSKKPMADFVQWILDIRQLCLKDGVLSGRVVSRWGIGYTLCRLCSKPIDCSLDNQNHGGLRRQGEDGPQNVKLGIQLIDNLPDLFAESFYQVILVVKPKEQDSILEKFKGQYLGQTGGKVIANRAVCWDVEQIQNAYESSWEVDFGF